MDDLWQIARHPQVPEYEKKRLIKIIYFIEAQEAALEAKHKALINLARRSTTLSGQKELSDILRRESEN